MSKKSQQKQAEKTKPKKVESQPEYDHPYAFSPKKFTDASSKVIKKYGVTNAGLENPDKLIDFYGCKFSVVDEHINNYCNATKGRTIRILHASCPKMRTMRMGKHASSALALSSANFLYNLLNNVNHMRVSENKGGKKKPQGKVINHHDLGVVLDSSPTLSKLGFQMIDVLKTRIKIPTPKTAKQPQESPKEKKTKKVVAAKTKQPSKTKVANGGVKKAAAKKQ